MSAIPLRLFRRSSSGFSNEQRTVGVDRRSEDVKSHCEAICSSWSGGMFMLMVMLRGSEGEELVSRGRT